MARSVTTNRGNGTGAASSSFRFGSRRQSKLPATPKVGLTLRVPNGHPPDPTCIREVLPYYQIVYGDAIEPGLGLTNGTPGPRPITIAPGKGFGDGRHETTQLCLLAIGYLLRSQIAPKRMLDFGAGNGILGIAAALTGAKVECVEIDEFALDEARRNAALNRVLSAFEFRTTLSVAPITFELIAANILLKVLIDFAEQLTQRLATNGYLVLSGLTATDVPSLLGKYRSLLPQHGPTVFERGEWRAVLFAPIK